jgi:hypothetical protein
MAVLRVNVDDYAEIWINGEMPRAAARPSPYTIQGFNLPHRIVLATETCRVTTLSSRCSRSMARYRPHPRISCGCARSRWNFFVKRGCQSRQHHRKFAASPLEGALHKNSRFLVKAQSFRSSKELLTRSCRLIHHRMPVILPTARRLWLGEEKAEPTNRSASSDHPAEPMRAYPDHEPAEKMIPNY